MKIKINKNILVALKLSERKLWSSDWIVNTCYFRYLQRWPIYFEITRVAPDFYGSGTQEETLAFFITRVKALVVLALQ